MLINPREILADDAEKNAVQPGRQEQQYNKRGKAGRPIVADGKL